MLKALRDHSQSQRLDAGDCLLPVLAISHHAGQRWDFGQPTAVVFSLDFHSERHRRNLPPAQFP